jgi:hypothetical protein
MTSNSFRNETGFPTASSATAYAGVVEGPLQAMMAMRTGDPTEVLPSEAREKYRVLEQKRDDAGILVRAIVEDQQQLRLDVLRHQNRIKELQTPRGAGGFGLGDDAPQVAQERRMLDGKVAEQRRLMALSEVRGATFQNAGRLIRNIEQAVAARPAGCIGQMVKVDPPTFKGDILNAIEGRRRRGRELKADLHRVRSAPWPSSIAKEKMRERIEQLAESGAPRADQAIEHDAPISFPTQTHQVRVFNADPSAVGFAELPDTLGLFAWLYRDALIAALDREIDEVADDPNALTGEQRRKTEADILADLLAVEREECALIDLAKSQHLPADYRADCDARAILGIEWVAAPPPIAREDEGQAGIIRRVGP